MWKPRTRVLHKGIGRHQVFDLRLQGVYLVVPMKFGLEVYERISRFDQDRHVLAGSDQTPSSEAEPVDESGIVDNVRWATSTLPPRCGRHRATHLRHNEYPAEREE